MFSGFFCMMWGRDPTELFCIWISSCPSLFVEEMILSPLSGLWCACQNPGGCNGEGLLGTLYSVPSISRSFSCRCHIILLQWLCSKFEIRKLGVVRVFLLKILGLFCTNCRISLLIPAEKQKEPTKPRNQKAAWILKGIALNLWIFRGISPS